MKSFNFKDLNLKELSYKLSKGELKEIKKNLYKIENKKGLLQ